MQDAATDFLSRVWDTDREVQLSPVTGKPRWESWDGHLQTTLRPQRDRNATRCMRLSEAEKENTAQVFHRDFSVLLTCLSKVGCIPTLRHHGTLPCYDNK